MSTPDALVRRYFELAVQPDTTAYVAQFAAAAVVEDDGTERHGLDEIRAWRCEVPAVTYSVRRVRAAGPGHAADVEIAGDFPGSPVVLTFRFTFSGEQITHLDIHP